jgi:hypothetical protein
MLNRKPAQQRPAAAGAEQNPFLKNFPAARSPRLNVGSPVTISASTGVLDVYNNVTIPTVIQPIVERPVTPVAEVVQKVVEEERPITPERPMAMVVPAIKGSYMWKALKFSPNLQDGSEVLIVFPWTISKYHVCSPVDEPRISELQENIQAYVKSDCKKSLIVSLNINKCIFL